MEVRPKERFVYKGHIPAAEIKKAYIKAFKVRWWDRLFSITKIALADATYRELDITKVRTVLSEDYTEKQKYVAEHFDCDDHTFSLMGAFHRDRDTAAMPIFITWILTERGGHALISCYYEGSIILIEPQTDAIMPMSEGYKLTLVCG